MLQVLLPNINSIQHLSFICSKSYGSRYCYVVLIIKFKHTVKKFQVFLFSTNNSIRRCSFVCIQLNGSKDSYISLTIQLVRKLFVYTQLKCQTSLFDPLIGPYTMLPLRVRVNLGTKAMKEYSALPKASELEPHHQIF